MILRPAIEQRPMQIKLNRPEKSDVSQMLMLVIPASNPLTKLLIDSAMPRMTDSLKSTVLNAVNIGRFRIF